MLLLLHAQRRRGVSAAGLGFLLQCALQQGLERRRVFPSSRNSNRNLIKRSAAAAAAAACFAAAAAGVDGRSPAGRLLGYWGWCCGEASSSSCVLVAVSRLFFCLLHKGELGRHTPPSLLLLLLLLLLLEACVSFCVSFCCCCAPAWWAAYLPVGLSQLLDGAVPEMQHLLLLLLLLVLLLLLLLQFVGGNEPARHRTGSAAGSPLVILLYVGKGSSRNDRVRGRQQLLLPSPLRPTLQETPAAAEAWGPQAPCC